MAHRSVGVFVLDLCRSVCVCVYSTYDNIGGGEQFKVPSHRILYRVLDFSFSLDSVYILFLYSEAKGKAPAPLLFHFNLSGLIEFSLTLTLKPKRVLSLCFFHLLYQYRYQFPLSALLFRWLRIRPRIFHRLVSCKLYHTISCTLCLYVCFYMCKGGMGF